MTSLWLINSIKPSSVALHQNLAMVLSKCVRKFYSKSQNVNNQNHATVFIKNLKMQNTIDMKLILEHFEYAL